MARRDLAIQRSYQFALLVRLGQTLYLTATLFFISKLVHHSRELSSYGGNYFRFALVGLIVVSFATLGLGAFSKTIADEQAAGTLEVLLTVPVRLGTFLAGALVVPLALTALEIIVYFAVAAAFFGIGFSSSGMLLALPLLLLTIATFCALGVISAGFIVLTKRGDPLALVGTQATAFLAGSLFPVTVLPGALQFLAKLVPAYYGLRGMRDALLSGAGLGAVAGDLAVLSGFALGLVPLSLWFFSWAVQAARTSGTLGTY